MALHTELPIYRTGVRLLDLAVRAQVQMPRTVKRALGEKITQHCVEMLDLMALANATQRDARAGHIEQLLTRQRAITVLLRVIEAGPSVAMRNVVENAAMKASDKPYVAPGADAKSEAVALLAIYASEIKAAGQCADGKWMDAGDERHFGRVVAAMKALGVEA